MFFSMFWQICRFAGKTILFLLKTLQVAVAAIWNEIGKLPHCEHFCAEIAGFFRGFGKGLGMLFYIPRRVLEWGIAQCDRSAKARRIFFIIAVIGGFFYYWYCTPSWPYGRWYSYESGIGSYYGRGFYFNKTAAGDWFLPGPFYTAAHKTLPLGTKVLVVNRENGKRVVVRINDRGPYVDGRIIDLTYAAARRIGLYQPGTAKVTIYTRRAENKNGRKISVWPFF